MHLATAAVSSFGSYGFGEGKRSPHGKGHIGRVVACTNDKGDVALGQHLGDRIAEIALQIEVQYRRIKLETLRQNKRLLQVRGDRNDIVGSIAKTIFDD